MFCVYFMFFLVRLRSGLVVQVAPLHLQPGPVGPAEGRADPEGRLGGAAQFMGRSPPVFWGDDLVNLNFNGSCLYVCIYKYK